MDKEEKEWGPGGSSVGVNESVQGTGGKEKKAIGECEVTEGGHREKVEVRGWLGTCHPFCPAPTHAPSSSLQAPASCPALHPFPASSHPGPSISQERPTPLWPSCWISLSECPPSSLQDPSPYREGITIGSHGGHHQGHLGPRGLIVADGWEQQVVLGNTGARPGGWRCCSQAST